MLFFIILTVGGLIVYQAYETKNKVDTFAKEVDALKEDCGKVESLRDYLYKLKDEIKSSCKNPILKWSAEKNLQQSLCGQIHDDKYINAILEEIKNNCEKESR